MIVDEQQRLGVGQRLALVKKGDRPHLVSLSATPIPRTLALALRGEADALGARPLALGIPGERVEDRLDERPELESRRDRLRDDDAVRRLAASSR